MTEIPDPASDSWGRRLAMAEGWGWGARSGFTLPLFPALLQLPTPEDGDLAPSLLSQTPTLPQALPSPCENSEGTHSHKVRQSCPFL